MSARTTNTALEGGRGWDRYSQIKDLSLFYEGLTEKIPVRPPDISPAGMFINTARHFPEGAVLHVRFKLAVTNFEINTRCEVRYCLTGVGIGVAFTGMSEEAERAIAQEIRMSSGGRPFRS